MTTYSEKYLWQSYFEFVGYLVLDGRLKSEDGKRFRSDDNFFDPTFPRLPKKFQLITDCLIPANDDNVQDWINSENDNLINDFLIHKIYTEDDWVLISLNLTQEGKDNFTRIHLSLSCFLIPTSNIKNLETDVNSKRFQGNAVSFHQIYAGEINWSKSIQSNEEDYRDDRLDLTNIILEYSWSSWSSNRYQNPSFKFLNPKLSNLIDIEFNTNDLCFYDKHNVQVTKIVWSENSMQYYAKKEIIEQLSDKLNLEVVWYQFISKYGEFGKHQDNKLNPKYNAIKKIIRYNDIKNNQR